MGTAKHLHQFHRAVHKEGFRETTLDPHMEHLNALAVYFLVVISVVSGETQRLNKLKTLALARSCYQKAFL